MIRHAATEEDKTIFDRILQKISDVDSYFCSGGVLELVDRPLTLFYRSKNTNSNNWLDFGSLLEQSATDRQTAIDHLLQACVPAPHGSGDKTVLDESYRLARELRHNEFALSTDILSEVGGDILSSISALTAGRLILSEDQDQDRGQYKIRPRVFDMKPELPSVPSLTMIPRLYKLNAYSENGFFKPHRDTPKGNDHIGTLMFALPIPHQGGALRVSHDGKEILFDWHQQCSEGVQVTQDGKVKITLPWAFLFSDIEHEVLPVESGTRVTIAYDIFSSKESVKNVNLSRSKLDGTTSPLCEEFVSALRNPSFLSKGAEVAIALSHSYPLSKTMKLTNQEFAAGLKGTDAIVYRAMEAAGFDVSLRAVLPQRSHREGRFDVPNDGYDPELIYRYIRGDHLVTSNIFTAYQTLRPPGWNDDEEDIYETVIRDEFGAEESPQLMWIKQPGDTFTNVGAYLRYANEYSLGFFYAAGAFVLNVPPFGEEYRTF